jgi:hypothetical protein
MKRFKAFHETRQRSTWLIKAIVAAFAVTVVDLSQMPILPMILLFVSFLALIGVAVCCPRGA